MTGTNSSAVRLKRKSARPDNVGDQHGRGGERIRPDQHAEDDQAKRHDLH